MNLARRLCKAGSDHRKFLRQIFVSVDILAPLYWWKEFDTYKIGTTSNSTSTMHTIHKNKITMENLSNDYLDEKEKLILSKLLEHIEKMRVLFLETKNKDYWYKIIQLLPSSFNQLRTCTMSYENLINIHFSRRNHKLDEWKLLCTWIESLPYFADIVLE